MLKPMCRKPLLVLRALRRVPKQEVKQEPQKPKAFDLKHAESEGYGECGL